MHHAVGLMFGLVIWAFIFSAYYLLAQIAMQFEPKPHLLLRTILHVTDAAGL